MANERFQNALKGTAQAVPPIWLMRQAGRYHSHYQKLREKHSFMDLCKVPELAAETAMGPIQDFDFDVAILFSDLLFPLEALGMGLNYDDHGPHLGWHLTKDNLKKLRPVDEALPSLEFQKAAVLATRDRLPKTKSLIGFVGGPWTLFSYACQGTHTGGLQETKKQLPLFEPFMEKLVPLLVKNIALQKEGGAEVVMIFDTAAGEISADIFQAKVAPALKELAKKYPGFLGYYSRGTANEHLSFLNEGDWAGVGYDHRWSITQKLRERKKGFLQGNFDQSLFFMDTEEFKKELERYLKPLKDLDPATRAGWVAGLGHGVLPKTPEAHVRHYVSRIREVFSR